MAEEKGGARWALVLHDQQIFLDLIELILRHGMFEVRGARTLDEAGPIMAASTPDLAVIDMDHDDSIDLVRALKSASTQAEKAVPILGLTRRGDLRTKLQAFELGVDDIVVVPFSPEELLARSMSITRRALGTDLPIEPTILIGEMEIDIVHRVVRAGDSAMHLSATEQNLLFLLASQAGRIVTREEILDTIWGPDLVAESNLVDRHVRTLRIKLQDTYRAPRFIATVPGRGYRFIPTFSRRVAPGDGTPD